MTRPPRKAFGGAKYHISVRGNGRQEIFHSDWDRERFIHQLKDGVEKDGVVLYAYVLMTNHYHLLIETPRGNVSRFMQRLNTAYGMYFRYKHQRPGHILQGRYKAKLVEGDEYLLRLTRYLHLNPVKIARLRKAPEKERLKVLRDYRWSSYGGYVEGKKEEEGVDYRWRELAGGRNEAEERRRYRRYVEGFVVQDDDRLKAVLDRSAHAVGKEEYVAGVERDLKEGRTHARVVHDVSWPAEEGVSLESVDKAVCRVLKCAPGLLRKHGRTAGVAKSLAIEAACRLSGKWQREVGEHYGGLSGAAVAQQRRKLAQAMAAQDEIREKLAAVIEMALHETK